MPTGKQDKDFASSMEDEVKMEATVGNGALDSAIFWIKRNLNPDDVFDESDLQSWAENNGYKKDE